MEEKYCVTIVDQPPRHPLDTMCALLETDETLAPLRLFNSIDEAVQAAQEDKLDYPRRSYEVRLYFGTNTNFQDIEVHGRWKIGAKVLRQI